MTTFDESHVSRVSAGDPTSRGGQFAEQQKESADPGAFPTPERPVATLVRDQTPPTEQQAAVLDTLNEMWDQANNHSPTAGWTRAYLDDIHPRHFNSVGGGLAKFQDIDGDTAAKWLANLEAEHPDQLDDAQNDAPTTREMLQMAANNPDKVRLHGYLVAPSRADERITFDSMTISVPTVNRFEQDAYLDGIFSSEVSDWTGADTQDWTPAESGGAKLNLWWD